MCNHPSNSLVMTVETVPCVFEISGFDRINDCFVVAPRSHRIGVFEIDEVGRLVECEPEHLDEPVSIRLFWQRNSNL